MSNRQPETTEELEEQAAGVAPSIPPVPRELTAAISSRAWLEPGVRFWWGAGVILLSIALYFLVTGWLAWHHEAALVERGTALEARIVEVTYLSQPLRIQGKSLDPSNPIRIEFDWKGARRTTRSMPATGHTGFVTVGQSIQVRVNPDDPDDWTELTRAEPLLYRTLGGVIALPAALLALLSSWLMRRKVLSIWRNGELLDTFAIDRRHSALAPRSRRVSCTPVAEGDGRIFDVYFPDWAGAAGRGDKVWVIAMKNSAVAASWFAGWTS